MCDSATYDVLRSIVSRRVALGEAWMNDRSQQLDPDAMFTALDISREAQMHFGISLRHREMKNEIHRIFDSGDMGDYYRQGIKIPDVDGRPFLYYPNGSNPSDYSSKYAPVQNVISQVSSAPSAPSNQTTKTVLKQKYETDNRGRLCIPKSIIESLGFKPGDRLYVQPKQQEVVITGTNSTMNNVHTYFVDKSGNVRLSATVLEKAQINNEPMYSVDRVQDEIIVTK